MRVRELLARAYLWNQRMFRIAHGGTQAVFEGFWMGLLPQSVTDVISQYSYGTGTLYSNDSWLDSGLQFWEELIVERFFTGRRRVLVGSAGGGREVIALVRAGFEADGFECSRPMVDAGTVALRRRGIVARLDWAPPCELPVIDHEYDAAIVGWNGYTYISPRPRRIDFLRKLKMHMSPGSPVLVSGALCGGDSRPAALTPRVANLVRRLTLREPVFDHGATFPGRPRHQFTKKRLEQELRDAGLLPVGFYKWGDYGAMVGMLPPDTSAANLEVQTSSVEPV